MSGSWWSLRPDITGAVITPAGMPATVQWATARQLAAAGEVLGLYRFLTHVF
jgi:hypothetical protein